MKKIILPAFILLLMDACQSKNPDTSLQSQIDSLQQRLANTYKPGFGEFMSGIQVHHAKLWFAGINNNWELADFEVGEIKEALEDLEKFETDRPETKSLPMLYPSLDSITISIQQKNTESFKKNYLLLTTTCNNCHQSMNFSFNEIKVPDTPPFSNQVFTKKNDQPATNR